MTGRKRVVRLLQGKSVDRVPLNIFAGWNPGVKRQVEEKYGNIDSFYRKFQIDIVTGVFPRFAFEMPSGITNKEKLAFCLQADTADPTAPGYLDIKCDGDAFLSVAQAIQYQKKGNAVFAHVWGVFELASFIFEENGLPGLEEVLINMAMEPEKMARLFFKLAEWSAACVENAGLCGVDVIQISDDWGQQDSLLFSPQMWYDLIYPATRIITDAAKKNNEPVILHSDGDITAILSGVKQLGISGLHPVQESAGMSVATTREKLGKGVCLMGGLDVVSALPSLNRHTIKGEVGRIFKEWKSSGAFIFSGSHMFQDDTSLEVIEGAYAEALELAPF